MEVEGSHNALDNKSEEDEFKTKGNSDPVVYQLVRVEGDGTLVPATEDEVLQFEHFLHDEKVDLPSIEDVGHVEEFFSNDCMLLNKSDLEEGSSKLETREVGTQKLGTGLEDFWNGLSEMASRWEKPDKPPFLASPASVAKKKVAYPASPTEKPFRISRSRSPAKGALIQLNLP
ncbi:hypothetical protein ACP70R_027888 [Stipagrostis hirtigluma subsp. patula]